MSTDKLTKLVEDWVSLRGVTRSLSDKLSKVLSSDTLLELSRVAKQLWGVQYHLSTHSMDELAKVLKSQGVALEKIYQASLKSGKRISRVKPKAEAKQSTKSTKTESLSFMS